MLLPTLLILVAVIFSVWFIKETGGYRETMSLGELVKDRYQFHITEQLQEYKRIMKRSIIKFLDKRGFAPRIDSVNDHVIWFTCEKQNWLVILRDNDNSVQMGIHFSLDKQIDMSLLLDNVNTANKEILYAKAYVNDDTLCYQVEFQCDSAKSFKRYFDTNASCVFAMAQRVAELENELDNLQKERQGTETSYDKIHYHTAYVAIPKAIRALSKYPKETAMRLDEVSYLKIGLLPHLTREEVSAFPWDELKITKGEVEHNQRLIVYEFPTPRRSPQAKFGVVLMDSENVPMDYVTLERSYHDPEDRDVEMNTPELNANVFWMLGTVVERENGSGAHLNYGLFQGEPTLDNFIQTAMAIFNTPKEERQFYTRG